MHSDRGIEIIMAYSFQKYQVHTEDGKKKKNVQKMDKTETKMYDCNYVITCVKSHIYQ